MAFSIIPINGKCPHHARNTIQKWNECGVHTVNGMLDELFAVHDDCMKLVVSFLKPVGIAIPTISKTSNHIFHFYSIYKMVCNVFFSAAQNSSIGCKSGQYGGIHRTL
jgi:hypothetical protein